ncbi:MAG: hypothetical protein NXH87_01360 [Rhodobiaceae bacterium]|nr:hypothetical protein [Rhodobiaceae bacterium]
MRVTITWVAGLLLSVVATLPANAEFRAGFGSRVITPQGFESWTDTDGDAQYNPDIDTYDDANGNGVFDAAWMAGFQNGRAAADVHDDLMAVAAVFDDGEIRIGIVTADVVGLMANFVASVRTAVPPELELDYVLVHATHNHEGPDTQGLWGAADFESGVSEAYMARLKAEMVGALEDSVAALEPARLSMATVEGYDAALGTMDTRKPLILDPGIRVLMLKRPNRDEGDDSVIGTLVNYGMHVELAWDKNLSFTADLAGYLRRGVSTGLDYDGEIVRPGIGGTTMWLTGNVGGLMTVLPGEAVVDPWTQEEITASGHGKARAFGYGVASAVLDTVLKPDGFYEDPAPTLQATPHSFEVPTANYPLAVASVIGLLDRDFDLGLFPPQLTTQSEVALLKIGEARIATIPGELYPEIAVGGIENPPGADYEMAPLEVPPFRPAMQGRVNLMVNLANDAIGYIIPKSEWDNEAPWIYGYEEETYGEIVSVGPDGAPAVHGALLPLLQADGPTP